MSERILVAVAWPYANGPLHLGHLAGAYLPADIFARYHRAKGNEVLMVSGSDQHGTPITLRAEQEGIAPQEVVNRYHNLFLQSWEKMGITFDLFTTTGTANHAAVVHDIFKSLWDQDYIYKGSMSLPYCHTCKRFLPDRYVTGTCPFCASKSARGDQCDNCNKPLSPLDLGDLRCRICGSAPEIRDSEHLFLRLSAFEEKLLAWVKQQTHWRSNVLNFTINFISEGLKDRAITRDLDWGVPVPLPGFEDKRIYVWFEAVIGYLSASIEWAKAQGDEERWRDFWHGEAKTYYFIGKDNIPFHAIIWPAMLMGYGNLNLPCDIPANEFLTLEGRQLSTSRNWAVWLPDYLERYEPDPLRYYLSAAMPETADANFSWREFLRRNNDELVATYGNLVHRVLSFTYRSFEGRVPTPGELDAVNSTLMAKIEATFEEVDKLLYGCHLKEAIRKAMTLAQEANRYIDEKAPWKAIKENPQDCATTLWCAIAVISGLKTILYPFLPFGSAKLHRLLGFNSTHPLERWELVYPSPGQSLEEPKPIFTKLDEGIVEEETKRLEGSLRSGD
ncbi:MAG: methionine--tRNA ligase [Dehalococcoidia bacterium]